MVDSSNLTPTEIWVWLFLAIYLVHIAEEFWGGAALANNTGKMYGVNLAPRQFLILSAITFGLIAALIYLAMFFGFPQWTLIMISTILLINGFSHTITSARFFTYNPGLITSILIFIPLGAITLLRLNENMRLRRFLAAVTVGAITHAAISLV